MRPRRETRSFRSSCWATSPSRSRGPDQYGLGDRDEAILYAADALKVWKSTPGAMTWVRDVFKKPNKQTTPARKAFGPSAKAKERLKRVPKVDDTWQAGFRRFPTWVESDGDRVLPWVVLVASRDSGLVVTTKLIAEEPTADLLWDILAEAIRQPAKKPIAPAAGSRSSPTALE